MIGVVPDELGFLQIETVALRRRRRRVENALRCSIRDVRKLQCRRQIVPKTQWVLHINEWIKRWAGFEDSQSESPRRRCSMRLAWSGGK